MLTMTKTTTPHPMSAGHRHADGSKRRNRAPKARAPNPDVLWRRLNDNIDDLVVKTGANPDLVSEVSRLVLFGHLTKAEGIAARRYAFLAGVNDRYMGITKRHAASQNYERGFGGEDQELERHAMNGTTKEYERRARKAKKDFEKLDRIVQVQALGARGRDLVESVCLYDRRVNERELKSLAAILRAMAAQLTEVPKIAVGPTPDIRDSKTVAESAVETLAAAFTKAERARIARFSIATMPGVTCSITGYVDEPKTVTHTIRVNVPGMKSADLAGQLHSAALVKGWKERT